ncbi:GAF domain-containing protein [Paraburkholderia hospita]|nr:GAF domain-containing protein [Paraburkholderia hospita]
MSTDDEDSNIEAIAALSNAFSEEVVLDRVLETIVRVALKCTGATAGQLMLSDQGTLRTRVRATSRQDVVVEIGSTIEDEPITRLIAQAVAQAGRSLTLDTANETAERFARRDSEARVPCSAFCLPLFHKRRLVAVLYLENDRANKAFPTRKRALIELLASQMAIALENARLSQALYDEERRRFFAEGRLRQAQFALSEATRATAIEELVGSIAHELSQPLSAIDASSGAALRWLKREVPNLEEATISLNKVQSCTTRAKVTIDRLRAAISQSKTLFEEFDVHAAIREVVLLARSRIDQLDVQIELAGMSVQCHVMGNRVQIQQVVDSLIANALDALTSITQRPRIISVSSARREGRTVVISVADSGRGIEPGSEDQLFRPFVTTKPRSIGIGLPICKRIIEAHGSAMRVEPLTPFGVRFSFTLDQALQNNDAD